MKPSILPSALRPQPFPHVVADNFFDEVDYATIVDHFTKVKRLGFGAPGDPDRLAKFPNYDCYYYVFPESDFVLNWNRCDVTLSPMYYFTSPRFRMELEIKFGLSLTRDVNCSYHHHPEGSPDGTIHSDYNVTYFADAPRPLDGINVWFHNSDYTGLTRKKQLAVTSDDVPKDASYWLTREPESPRETARSRAAAYLYYFGKQPKGGGTGIYSATGELVEIVEPVPNRLLVFSISPTSFHRFLGNTCGERNTIIGWFHNTLEAAERRHGTKRESFAPLDQSLNAAA